MSCPAVGLMIVHLSSSPPEFMRKMESMILLSILTASLACDPPLEAVFCWGAGPPEVWLLCPELDADFCCRPVFCGGSVFDEPITHHVGSSPITKSSGYFDFVHGAVVVLVEVDHDTLLGFHFDLLQPAHPLAPILILSGPVSRVRRMPTSTIFCAG